MSNRKKNINAVHENLNTIGQRLKYARVTAVNRIYVFNGSDVNIRLQDVANIAKISPQLAWALENDKIKKPDINYLQAICQYLNVRLDWILTGKGVCETTEYKSTKAIKNKQKNYDMQNEETIETLTDVSALANQIIDNIEEKRPHFMLLKRLVNSVKRIIALNNTLS